MIPKLFFELLNSAAAVETRQQRPATTILTIALNEYLFMLYPFKANIVVVRWHLNVHIDKTI